VRRAFRSLLLGLAWASIWPAYLVLFAQAARLGPWPRNLGVLASTVLHALAIAALIPSILTWLLRRDGWAERFLGVPTAVGRQVCRAGRFLTVAAVVCLVPAYLLTRGEVAPQGRPITAAAISRFFILSFEIIVWVTLVGLLRRGSALLSWFDIEATSEQAQSDTPRVSIAPITGNAMAGSDSPASGESYSAAPWLAWLSRRRRPISWVFLAAVAGIVVLDARGYRYTSRRLAGGGTESLAILALGWALYRGLSRIIVKSCRRWGGRGRSWARALTTAVALRGSARSRGVDHAALAHDASAAAGADPVQPEDLAGRLCQLLSLAIVLLGALAFAWVWELDFALIRFLANQEMWSLADQTPVTLGDLAKATAVILAGALAWRYMSTLFAVTLFPRIPDDPGVRFAIVTLCRYAALAISAIAALGSIHLGLAQIGVVLAALGVGLGFGLQEIVSNFVCGIILLLERPIRIGDVVTVANTTGKVDRINIRATTIINGDNQSMIVPNREFITGNLVNWTHKDKILRVTIKVAAPYGTDPEQIVDLLLAIAHDDPDVLRHPLPSALLEELGDSALKFALYAFVPDPGLVGSVKHRLATEIQHRFGEAQVGIPYPTHEVHLCRVPDDLTRVLEQPRWLGGSAAMRVDQPSASPPPPHVADAVVPDRKYQPVDDLDEEVHRAVDE
jgi:potassium-dependent mechanosensitive channel